jgi:hypothetical protein
MIPYLMQQIKNPMVISPWIVGPIVFLLWVLILLQLKQWILGIIAPISRDARIGYGRSRS